MHVYLSTACEHAMVTSDPENAEKLHEYCQSERGTVGLKKPARCKFCEAPCICRCHDEERTHGDS